MKRVAVVDMDDTLAIPRKLTYYLWTLARWIFNFGRRLQKRNDKLFETLKGYDEIVVLTARTEKHRKITEHQLRKWGVNPKKIVFCPINRVVYEWKRRELDKIDAHIEWFDNLKYTLGAEG